MPHMPKIAMHPSPSSFSLAVVHLIQMMSVLSPISQREICCTKAAVLVRAKGPSSAALPPTQSQGSYLSKSRNKAAHTPLPLWALPPSDQCLLRGFLSSVQFVESVTCSSSHALQVLAQLPLKPASAFGPDSIHV